MNLNEIINNVRVAQENYNGREINNIIEDIKEIITQNFDILSNAYRLDKKEELNLNKLIAQLEIEKIDERIEGRAFKNEYGKVGNIMVPYGILGVISNCDVYNILRIIILALQTKNGLIINITENVGVNFLLIENIKNVLQNYNATDLIEIYNNKAGEKLEENEKIDGIIYVGKRADSERFKILVGKPVIYTGCGNYELYIEDNLDRKLIEKVKENPRLKIYSNPEIQIGQEVASIDEAILRIAETGNGYAAGIITRSRESAKKFVEKVKARNVFVNALPTLIDNNLDLKAKDLMYEKSILVYDDIIIDK